MKKISSLCVAVGMLVASASAHAATYIITYKGTVVSGQDLTGEFGMTGSLAGLDFTSVFTLTSPLPGAFLYDDGAHAYISGGSVSGLPSPLSATLTINGVTRTSSGNYASQAHQLNNYGPTGFDDISHQSDSYYVDAMSQDHRFNIYLEIYSELNDFVSNNDYTSPLAYTVQTGDSPSGGFAYADLSLAGALAHYAFGSLKPNSVTIARAATPGVPEPATWTTMILGFGLAGEAVRRSRRTLRTTRSLQAA